MLLTDGSNDANLTATASTDDNCQSCCLVIASWTISLSASNSGYLSAISRTLVWSLGNGCSRICSKWTYRWRPGCSYLSCNEFTDTSAFLSGNRESQVPYNFFRLCLSAKNQSTMRVFIYLTKSWRTGSLWSPRSNVGRDRSLPVPKVYGLQRFCWWHRTTRTCWLETSRQLHAGDSLQHCWVRTRI